MAAKPPKPPTTNNIYDNNTSNNHQTGKFHVISQSPTTNTASSSTPTSSESEENSPSTININKNFSRLNKKLSNNISDCPCTNISIMQLFHEMKQEFPTVPDHIVNQCVIDNCHDRETCVENLKRELASHPNTVQSYPAQILRNNQQNHNSSMCNNKVVLKPTRPAPVPKVNNINCRNNLNNSNNCIKVKNKCSESDKTALSRNNACDVQQLQKTQIVNDCNDDNQQQKQVNSHTPQRPTTLSFREPFPQNQTGAFDQNQQRVVHKPIRRAPLPPTCKPQKVSQSQQPQSVNLQQISAVTSPQSAPVQSQSAAPVTYFPGGSDQSYSSASIQSPLSFSDSGESEISVNISLSPSSERSRGGPITRRTTSITVQPEPPYTRDFISQNPRSYTSLNLTLRKPGVTPQSPIDITAGPGLTYSSSSFDARRGYQKSFHITVTDQGSTFSASRIRPRTVCNVPTTTYPEEQEMMDTRLPLPSQYSQLDDITPLNVSYSNNNSPQEDAIENLIKRQRNRKDALARCLQKNKQKLQHVQNEIKILISPVKAGESERLDSEIERLRCDCQNILQEIENTKRSALPNNNVNYYDNEQLLDGRYQNARLQYSQSPHHHYTSFHNQPTSSLSLQYQPTAPPSIDELRAIGHSSRPMTTTTTVTMNQQQQQQQPQQQQQQFIDETNLDGGPPWTCSMCTFQNHPLLNKCECCDNIRQIPEPVITSREDIHIHLSPGENRVIHSWIVS